MNINNHGTYINTVYVDYIGHIYSDQHQSINRLQLTMLSVGILMLALEHHRRILFWKNKITFLKT